MKSTTEFFLIPGAGHQKTSRFSFRSSVVMSAEIDQTTSSTSLVKYLQILAHEEIPQLSISPNVDLDTISIHTVSNITIDYYRTLYNTVGAMWLWNDRRVMADDALYTLITDPDVTIHVLKVKNQDAGYFELDWKKNAQNQVENVEILYFGLFPDYVGLRIGPWFLNEALRLIRSREPQARIWVHTCSWDHPKALITYEKAGFKWYKEEIEPITIPSWYSGPTPQTN